MTRIVEVDAGERYAVAEAGVLNDDLRQAVAAHGLWYPPRPASYRIPRSAATRRRTRAGSAA